MRKFKLEITLGGAMNSNEAIASALVDIAARLRSSFPANGTVRDANGNKVGGFQFSGVRRG